MRKRFQEYSPDLRTAESSSIQPKVLFHFLFDVPTDETAIDFPCLVLRLRVARSVSAPSLETDASAGDAASSNAPRRDSVFDVVILSPQVLF